MAIGEAVPGPAGHQGLPGYIGPNGPPGNHAIFVISLFT